MSQSLLKPYHWNQRVLLVFAPNEDDQKLKVQQEIIEESIDGYHDRDLVVFHIFNRHLIDPNGSINSEKAVSDLRRYYGIADRQFMVILVGKDGGEKLRSDRPLSSDLLFPVIDAMPMRRREMREGNLH